MRVTTFSVAAMVLIAAGLATFWPGRNAGPGMAEAVAQAPAGGTNQPAEALVEKSLEAKLNERIDVEFVETPLKDALTFIGDRCNVQFVFKQKALSDAGVSHDHPVTRSLKQVRLNTILEIMLQDIGLVHTEKDDLLIITTPDDAESTLEIRVYDCRDLLAMPEPGGRPGRAGSVPNLVPATGTPPSLPRLAPPGTTPEPSLPGGSPNPAPPSTIPLTPLPGSSTPARAPRPAAAVPELPNSVLPQFAPADVLAQQGGFGGEGGLGGGGFGGGIVPAKPLTEHEQRAQRLIDLIMTNVDPDSWTDMGGAGSISEYHGLIVVTQTAQTHKKVEHVLNMLRQAAGLESPQGNVVR